MVEVPVVIRSGQLHLEGMWQEGSGPLGAVVLHPHPQYGGDMDNHVVIAMARGFAASDASTLRLNFRGVGSSEGEFADGVGESDDARAAISFVRMRLPDRPILVAGYSFGAMIAASVVDESTAGLFLVSPPVAVARLSPFREGMNATVITGDQDTISPSDAVKALASPSTKIEIVAGADHGWWSGVEHVEESAKAFALRLGVADERPAR